MKCLEHYLLNLPMGEKCSVQKSKYSDCEELMKSANLIVADNSRRVKIKSCRSAETAELLRCFPTLSVH